MGPYVLGKMLGVGSTAQVYEGLDPTNQDRKVAIKVLLGSSDKARTQAILEAQIMSKLRHENITGVIGLIQVSHKAFQEDACVLHCTPTCI